MLGFALIALWTAPVDGPLLGAFVGGEDPFARGLRRAVVLEARAGEPVRAPCGGDVLFAGATPRGPAVTLRCGNLRATVMPVRAAVRHGHRVRRGARVGTALGPLRLSAREPDGAYVRPPLAAPRDASPPPAAPAAGPRALLPRAAPVPPLVAPVPPLVAPVTPRVAPVSPRVAPVPPRVAPPPPPAVPWPAWLGVAMVLGAGLRLRLRLRAPRARRRLEPSTAERPA